MGVTQWVLIGLVVVLLIAYPILMSRKSKKDNEKLQEQTNSLKRGDEILTTSGVYGKVLEVKQDGEAKKVIIETGSDKNKSYLTVDAYSIYAVLNKEPVKEPEAKKTEEKTETKKEKNNSKAEVKDKKVESSDKKQVATAEKEPAKAESKEKVAEKNLKQTEKKKK